jgi:hypothetical protein
LATFACDLDFTLDAFVSAPAFDFAELVSTPEFDFFDFAPLDLDEYMVVISISSNSSMISAVLMSVVVFDLADLEGMDNLAELKGMDKNEGRMILFDDLEGIDKEEELLRRIFDDFVAMNDSSSLAEAETECEAFLALGRGGSLKMRYALE